MDLCKTIEALLKKISDCNDIGGKLLLINNGIFILSKLTTFCDDDEKKNLILGMVKELQDAKFEIEDFTKDFSVN